MEILTWVIVGGIAGWIASMIAGTNASMGVMANIVVGVVGALIGGFIFNMLGGSGFTGFNFWSLFVAIVGAVILLFVIKAFRGGSAPTA
ncbi:MAG TPA: GlsB/YeaQ/YmgE family stress response membrane protein [Candidatus Saccharimonadales bacterium]|nr:GlsB/YeaQ/YmgE family stress response membrane protein [Candidatus Saccharimonadales bacterium]